MTIAAADLLAVAGDGDAALAHPAGDGVQAADDLERLVELVEALGELGLRGEQRP